PPGHPGTRSPRPMVIVAVPAASPERATDEREDREEEQREQDQPEREEPPSAMPGSVAHDIHRPVHVEPVVVADAVRAGRDPQDQQRAEDRESDPETSHLDLLVWRELPATPPACPRDVKRL